jgi:uncharacterized LabA/DUF88 family protein
MPQTISKQDSYAPVTKQSFEVCEPSSSLNAPLTHSGFNSVDERLIQKRLNRSWAAIFIDGPSLYYAAQQLGIEINYSKFLYELAKNHRFLRAFFYTTANHTNEKQQGFLLWMRRNGYRVITKDFVLEHSKPANLDVEIAVDMMQLAHCCETMVLVSGDGNLAYAVDRVTYQGVQVEVVSLRSMLSERLLNVCDRFIDFETLKHTIQKEKN